MLGKRGTESLLPFSLLEPIMFNLRDSPVGAGLPSTPPRPPGFDPEIYVTVPTFNRRADLLVLTVSFMVRIPWCRPHGPYANCP